MLDKSIEPSKPPALFSRDTANIDPRLYHNLALAQGGRFFQTSSALWFESRRFVFDSVPPHRPVSLLPGEANRLFLRGALILRHTCAPGDGAPSFEFVCDDKNFGLASLAPDARRRARRGLDSCVVKPISFETLAAEGAAINRSVLARHGRGKKSFLADDAQWKKYVALCAAVSNTKAFGAFVEGRLCAIALMLLVDDYSYFYHTHAHTEFLKHSPMNALIFTVTREMLANPSISCVSQGIEPIFGRGDLQHFKLAMGYRQRPIDRKILVNPVLRPFLVRPMRHVAEKMLRHTRPRLVEPFSRIADAVAARHRTFESPFVRES